MGSSDGPAIESMLEQTGGCGRFQVMMVASLLTCLMSSAWSLMFMAFGNYNPGWYCADSSTLWFSNDSMNASIIIMSPFACEAHRNCSNVVYLKGSSTLVTEWDLACDKAWIIDLIISVKMAGVFFGTVIAGYLANYVGRKTCHYGTLAVAAILNLILAFSVNWEMYTVLQFPLGITTGCTLITSYLYPLEFVVNKWRGIVAALPLWISGCISFAVGAMILKDWKHLHIGAAVVSAALALPILWVPESIRWLVVRGESGKANRIAMEIAKYNRKEAPAEFIASSLAQKGVKRERNEKTFTIADLYRYGFLPRTVIMNFAWFAHGVAFYVIVFNTKSLTGDIYLNLLLTISIPSLSSPIVPLFSNTLGRRWSYIIFTGIHSAACFSLVAYSFSPDTWDKAQARRITTFITMILVDGGWATITFYDLELFPTMLRSLSQGHASSISRIGALIAPFIIPKRPEDTYISQIIMATLMLITCVSFVFLPETKGKPMEDFLITENDKKTTEEDNGHASSLLVSAA